METLSTYFIKFLWVAGTATVLWAVNKLAYKGYFDKFKFRKDGTTYRFDPINWNVYFRIFAIVLLGVVALSACSADEPAAPAQPVSALCPSVIEGTVDAPPMADRVEALRIEAASKGITLTGNYAVDVAAQGGEMMLIGTGFKFVFDAGCQIDKSQSHLNLFLTDYPVEGGMAADGSLGMAVDAAGAKVGVKGRVVDGKFIDGEVRKGWLPHIYGVLNGAWRRL